VPAAPILFWRSARADELRTGALRTASGTASAASTQNRVVATTLAPGVVLMGGGSHNSLAVEFKDFLTVIDG
jgi:hypothetical protein